MSMSDSENEASSERAMLQLNCRRRIAVDGLGGRLACSLLSAAS